MEGERSLGCGEAEEVGVLFDLLRLDELAAAIGEADELGVGLDLSCGELVEVGGAIIGEADGPGEVGWGAVAAAVEEATDAAEAEREDDTGGDDVHAEADGDFLVTGVEDEGGCGEEEAAVVGEAAAGDVDHVEEVLGGGEVGAGEFGEVFEDVAESSADDAREEGEHGGIDEGFAVEAGAIGEVLSPVCGDEETYDEHEAEAVDGDGPVEDVEMPDFLNHSGCPRWEGSWMVSMMRLFSSRMTTRD